MEVLSVSSRIQPSNRTIAKQVDRVGIYMSYKYAHCIMHPVLLLAHPRDLWQSPPFIGGEKSSKLPALALSNWK
jgi:hypothetical protein